MMFSMGPYAHPLLEVAKRTTDPFKCMLDENRGNEDVEASPKW